MLSAALAALEAGDDLAALDRIPAAIYLTDREGTVTHFNEACIALAGRTPVAQRDRWCVTWKLYTADGAFLPHDQCPMAVAIREKREIRDIEAIAERPDGSRVNLLPYPTPLFDDDGELIGAVNLLLDVTDERQLALLHARIAQCRRLAGAAGDQRTAEALHGLAAEYEEQARQIERPN